MSVRSDYRQASVAGKGRRGRGVSANGSCFVRQEPRLGLHDDCGKQRRLNRADVDTPFPPA